MVAGNYNLKTPMDVTSNQNSKSTRIPQYISTGIMMVAGFNFGNVLGWSSPALRSIENIGCFLDLNNTDLSWIGSLVTVGAIVGSPIAGYCISKFGRRKTLFISAVPLLLGWLFLAMASKVYMLCIGRFLTGIGAGFLALVLPVYLTEISEPEIRGCLGGILGIVVKFGILFTYTIGSIVSHHCLSGICGLFPIIFAILTLYLPESPRYLLTIGQSKKALESLCWLRASQIESPSKQVLQEIQEMQDAQIGKDKDAISFKVIFSSATLKPLLLLLTLVVFNQFSGGSVLGFYTVSIFDFTGSSLTSNWSGVIVGLFQVLATITIFCVVEKIGRKTILISSLFLMFISLLLLGEFLYLQNENPLSNNSGVNWIPLVCLVVYNASYCGGMSSLVWTVMGELLPTKTIGFTSALATTFNWTLAFVTTRFFYSLTDTLGWHHTFWCFATVCASGVVFIYFCIPETKGKSLDKIQQESFAEETV